RERTPAAGRDLGDDGAVLGRGRREDGDGCGLLGVLERDLPAEAAPAARDERHLAGERGAHRCATASSATRAPYGIAETSTNVRAGRGSANRSTYCRFTSSRSARSVTKNVVFATCSKPRPNGSRRERRASKAASMHSRSPRIGLWSASIAAAPETYTIPPFSNA